MRFVLDDGRTVNIVVKHAKPGDGIFYDVLVDSVPMYNDFLWDRTLLPNRDAPCDDTLKEVKDKVGMYITAKGQGLGYGYLPGEDGIPVFRGSPLDCKGRDNALFVAIEDMLKTPGDAHAD